MHIFFCKYMKNLHVSRYGTRNIFFILFTLFSLIYGKPSLAQDYPTKPIKLIAPFAPGGPTDVMARLIGNEMAKTLGQPVIVENKAGAAGAIGANFVAKSVPDGYTLCYCTTGPLVTIPLIESNMPYRPLRDLLPVSQTARLELVLAARNGLAANTIPELIALAKTNPGKISYGVPGIGGPNHLAVELLETMASIKLLMVPYKGDQPILTDMIGGNVDLFLGAVLSAAPLVRSGKIKAIAVTGSQRSAILPSVPTIAESGYPKYEASTFAGIHAPAGTPYQIIEKLQRAIASATAKPEIRKKMLEQGMVAVSNSTDAYGVYWLNQIKKWENIATQAGITPK